MKIFYKIMVMYVITCISLVSGASILKNSPQPICSGDITLTSQAEVNAFPSTYGCKGIIGYLYISGSDITNLDSLHALSRVTGSVTIGNSALSNLHGLNGLTFIGERLWVSSNALLANLDGLSSLDSIGYWRDSFESLLITNNPSLTSVKGLKALTYVPGIVDIESNATLPNLDGFEGLTKIGLEGTRHAFLTIQDNASLTNINGLSSIKTIEGYYGTGIFISNNPSLINLDGLSSLTGILGGYMAGISILNNISLTDVSGLVSLNIISAALPDLTIKNNPNLTMGGCALYPILHKNELACQTCVLSTITGNGTGFTKAIILAGGPCAGTQSQPDALLFTNITDKSMTVSYTAPFRAPAGYIILMRAFSWPSPEDAPVDGTSYHVGDVIGSSTIVVGAGNETSLNVIYLNPATSYYFDVFSYYTGDNGIDYLTTNPLAGVQRTDNEIQQPTDITFSAITSNSLTVSFTAPVSPPDGYITLMRAFEYPFPEDAPVDGTIYHVGNIIGSSTIVVGAGIETSLNIIYLNSSTDYYFDVFSYHYGADGYYYLKTNPLAGNLTTAADFALASSTDRTTPFPNPFIEDITIPFTTKSKNTMVQIIVYDPMGNRVADLVNHDFEQGYHEVKWDRTNSQGSKVTQGMYMYSLKTNEADRIVRGTLIAK